MKKFVNGQPVKADAPQGKGFHKDAPQSMSIESMGGGAVVRTHPKPKGKSKDGYPNYQKPHEQLFTDANQLIGHVAKHFKGGMKVLLCVLLLSQFAKAQTVIPLIKASQAAPTLTDGKYYTPTMDTNGNIRVTVSGISVSGGNAAAGVTGGNVPGSANYTGGLDTATGHLLGITTTNGGGSVQALDVFIKGGVASGSNFGSTFPTAGQAVGFKASGGVNMAAGNLSAAGNILVDGSTVTQPISGHITVDNCISGCSSSTAPNDNTAFTAGTTPTSPFAGFYHSVRDSVTDNRSANIAINVNRAVLVQLEDASKNGITSNSTTYSGKAGLDGNLLGTLGTAFTTAGFVDIKGADGNVFVRQTTAANLNATVVGTGTFATQSAITAASGSIASGAIAANSYAVGAIRDGADTALGTTTDARCTTTDTTSCTQIALMKQLSFLIGTPTGQQVSGSSNSVTQCTSCTWAVSLASASAVTLTDGADTTLGAKTDAKSTATDATSVTAMQVFKEMSAMLQAPASTPVTNAGTFAVQPSTTTASATDRSGTVTTGGTSQTLAASNGSRKCIYVINPPDATSQNIGTSEILYVNLTSAASTSATGSSIAISAGQQWSSCFPNIVTTEAITVTAATTSHHFIAKEF